MSARHRGVDECARRCAQILLAAVALWVVLTPCALSQDAADASEDKGDPMLIKIGAAEGEAGDVVSVPINLVTNGNKPSLVLFRLSFDPTKLEFSTMEAGVAASDAGKEISRNEVAPGAINIIVWGLNLTVLEDGELLTVDLKIVSAGNEESLALEGGTASAADPDAVPIAVDIESGAISVSCTGPDAPAGVRASRTRRDGVLVSWNRTDGATEYQVLRSDSDDETSATAVSGWISENLSYLDSTTTAASGGVVPFGCAGEVFVEPVYYYWVRARNDSGCESPLSSAVWGFRLPAKSGVEGLSVYERVLPSALADSTTYTYAAQSESTLCIRVASQTAIDLTSVWGAVMTKRFESSDVRWIPASEGSLTDGWIIYEPSTPWLAGEAITMTGGATTVDGESLGPLSFEFVVDSKGADSVGGDSVGGDGVGSGDEALLTADGVEAYPELSGGVGDVQEILPAEAYDVPLEVWLPVPADSAAEDFDVYYYHGGPEDAGWYPAESIAGWLVAGSREVVEWDGVSYVQFFVNHGGTVQLGLADSAEPVLATASVVPGMGGASSRGDILAVAALVLVLSVAGRGMFRRGSVAVKRG